MVWCATVLNKMRLKKIASVQMTMGMSMKKNVLGCKNNTQTLLNYVKFG